MHSHSSYEMGILRKIETGEHVKTTKQDNLTLILLRFTSTGYRKTARSFEGVEEIQKLKC